MRKRLVWTTVIKERKKDNERRVKEIREKKTNDEV
jgi:flagellar biosynthesis chaperone FliJ